MIAVVLGWLGNLLGGPLAKALRRETQVRGSLPTLLRENWQLSSASVSSPRSW